MNSRTVVATFSASLILLISVGCFGSRHSEQIRREMHVKAQALKKEVDALFPIGAPQSTVVEFLRKRRTEFQGGGTDGPESWISIGQVPSRVWYCGPWEVGIVARFQEGRLVQTYVTSWSVNCL
jgi:hypothetical protein